MEQIICNGQINQNELYQENTCFINLQLVICDTGVGISPDGIKNLFMDFGKLDENSSRNKGGTGLGLSICKQIIEQMGGSVQVLSKQGVGTQFVVSFSTKCKIKKLQLKQSWESNSEGVSPKESSISIHSQID